MSRPAIFKRFSLEGISEGWTAEHYIKYRPFNYEDLEQLEAIDEKNKDGVKKMRAIFADKFVEGYWLVEADNGKTKTEAMGAQDISLLDVQVVNDWLKQAMGKVDPKAKAS